MFNCTHHIPFNNQVNRSVLTSIKYQKNIPILHRSINYLIKTDEPKEKERIIRSEKFKLTNWKEKSSTFFMKHMKKQRPIELDFQHRTINRLWNRFLDCTNCLKDADEEYKRYEEQADILTKAANVNKSLMNISEKFDRLRKLDPLDYRKVLTITNDHGAAINSKNMKQCCPRKSFSEFVHKTDIVKTTGSELILYVPPIRKKTRFLSNVEDFANNYFSIKRSKA